MYAGRIVEEGPGARGLRRARASLHARARGGLPGDRRPRVPPQPVGPAGRPARPARAAQRLPVPSRAAPTCATVCPRTDVELWPAGPERRAACVNVLPAEDGERRGQRMADAPLLELRDLHVRFRGAHGSVARAVDGVDLALPAGRGAGARGRVGLRQDDARAHDHGTRAAGGGRGALPRRAAALRPRSLRGYRRAVQMIFQDPTGALNVRQTIYEAVAEGLRIQKVGGRRAGAGRGGALARRACARPSASSRSTRTRSPAASASAS